MGRISGKTAIHGVRKVRQVGGISDPISARRNYGGAHFQFPHHRWGLIYRIATPDESHFGLSGDSEGRPRWADFVPIPDPFNYERPMSQFCDLPYFWKIIHRVATSDVPYFGQKRRFRAIADGVRVSARFPPFAMKRGVNFPNFTILPYFFKLISRIATSDEAHFGQKTAMLTGAPTVGGFQSGFHPLQLLWFSPPTLRFCRTLVS